MANITLNDEMIRGAINGAVEQQHRVSSTVWSVIHSETSRALTAADGTTPAATKYAEMAKLWTPAVQAVYADPAAPKGTITDPSIGKTRIVGPQPRASKHGGPTTQNGIPTQIGPFSWNPIKFSNIGVSGQFQLTLTNNGGWNFSGIFFDPDFFDYTDSLAVVVVDGTGIAYTFAHTGNMQGWSDRWFEGGSESDTWGNSGTNAVLAQNWNNMFNANGGAEWCWFAHAAINVEIGPCLTTLMGVAGAATKIVQVVAALAA